MKLKRGFWRTFALGAVLLLTALIGTFAVFTQYVVGVLALIALGMMFVVSATQRG